MPSQITLRWTVSVINSSIGPTEAAARLAAVILYQNDTTDPVLGQLFGLTVAGDVSETDGTGARRTLTLNMDSVNSPKAPPPFPCHPRTSTPPVLPYPLRRAVTLAGSFFVTTGQMSVATTASQIPSLNVGDKIQFLSQQGVFYEVASVGASTIGITAAYSGKTANTGAFKEVTAPVTLAAIYSSSDLDTDGVGTTPAIAAGPGARTISLSYKDASGMGTSTVSVSLTGKRPAAVALAPGSTDISQIEGMSISSAGGFGNNVGQLTLVELSSALPAILSNRTPADFKKLTDDAQMLIENALAYLPPSYFSLAQQSASVPMLSGEFRVTTGSTNVFTSEDQTSALASSDTIEFAAQPGTVYEIAQVTEKIVTLTTAYTGIDTNNTGLDYNPGVKGNVGKSVINKRTGATLVSPSAATAPSNAALSFPLGQFVNPQVAAPPPNPPLLPSSITAPTVLSGLYTRTIALALAGVGVVSATIGIS